MIEPTLEQIGRLAVEYYRIVLDDGPASPIARAAQQRLFAAIDRTPQLSRARGRVAAPALGKPSLELAIFMVHERCRREMEPTLHLGGNDVGGSFRLNSLPRYEGRTPTGKDRWSWRGRQFIVNAAAAHSPLAGVVVRHRVVPVDRFLAGEES